MKTKHRIYLVFAKLLPKNYIKHIEQLLIFAGEEPDAKLWIGTSNLLGILTLLISVLFPFSLYNTLNIKHLIIGLTLFISIHILTYIIISLKVQDRSKRIEDALPDALQLIASNLKAGMTPFQALKLSARKEFGPLAEEIDYATSMALGSESFTNTLKKISTRVESEVLNRALELFTSAMKSGGHLAQMLTELADDISQTKQLKEELITNTKAYTAFIMFTIIIGTPLLLAISIYFVDVITGMQSNTGGDVGFGMDFLSGELEITVDFLTKVSIIMLTITALLASMLLGVIKEGQEKQGLKTAPLIITACLLMFGAFSYLIKHMFGNLL